MENYFKHFENPDNPGVFITNPTQCYPTGYVRADPVNEAGLAINNYGETLVVLPNENKMAFVSMKNMKLKPTYISEGTITEVCEILVHTEKAKKEPFYIFTVCTASFYTNQFIISKNDMENPKKFFNILSKNGIRVFLKYRNSAMIELFLLYIYKNLKITGIEYPYSPGWHNKKFYICEEISYLTTPFFKKRLHHNNSIAPAKSAKNLLSCIINLNNRLLSFFIFIIIHSAMLFSLMPESFRLKKPIVFFGESQILNKLYDLFFCFFKEDNSHKFFLHDKDVIAKLEDSKDEIFAITDSPKTYYQKNVSTENFGNIKNYLESGKTQCICIILSNCGIVKNEPDVIGISIKDINTLNLIDTDNSYLQTHIKHFTSWAEKSEISFRKLPLEYSNIEYHSQANMFLNILKITTVYYDEVANIDLFSIFKIRSGTHAEKLIFELLNVTQEDMCGSWICEKFKEVFFDMIDKNKLILCNPRDDFIFSDDRITALEYTTDICIRYCDMDKFLKYFPENLRVIDILRELKAMDLLISDKDKLIRKKSIKNTYIDMVSIKKEFLTKDIGEV